MEEFEDFKDFWIAVGQPGAYSKSMVFKKKDLFGLNERYGIKIKHAPFSVMPKIKNVVVQSWKDEDGDDVWLPYNPSTGQTTITHEAVDFNPTFVIFNRADADGDREEAQTVIKNLLEQIEGRWLKIWDEYTGIGYDGVYLLDVDDDPKFKRRNYDYAQFTLKFKINGPNIKNIFEEVVE